MCRHLSCLFLLLALKLPAADRAIAPSLLPPDSRYKADLLLVVAHPDDDVVIGGYLARIALDEHKRIAVIYCTDGDGGGNSVGNEAGAALGQMRKIEARRALAAWGIQNVWFLDGHDNPGQNLLWSLDIWNHGKLLDNMVRLVRLTRPDVVLTWLPDYVVGENHDDHQASGVLATEAFDASADAMRFPEQISPPANRTGMSNHTEGLHPWQPQKLYYFTDAFEDFGPYWHDPHQLSPFRPNIVDHHGPAYSTTDVSPSRHKSYAVLTAEQQAFYLTQEGDIGEHALNSHDFRDFEYPAQLIFGKSLVGGSVTGDVFDGVSSKPVPFAPVRGYVPAPRTGLSFEIGDPWRFYQRFWKAHNIDRIAALLPVPEAALAFGNTLHVPLVACNYTTHAEHISITPDLPAGWMDKSPFNTYPVQPGECYPFDDLVAAPASGVSAWRQIGWSASAGARKIANVSLRVYLGHTGGSPK